MTQEISPEFITSIDAALRFWDRGKITFSPAEIEKTDRRKQTLYTTLDHAAAHPKTQIRAAEVATQYFQFIERQGYWYDWLPMLNILSQSSKLSLELKCKIYIQLSVIQSLSTDTKQAIATAHDTLNIAQQIEDNHTITQAYYNLATHYFDSHNFSQTIKFATLALDLYQEDNEDQPWLLGGIHNILGLTYYENNQQDLAVAQFNKAINQAEKLDLLTTYSRILNNLSRSLLELERYDETLQCIGKAIDIASKNRNLLDKCDFQITLGVLFYRQEKWDDAEQAFRKANTPFIQKSSFYRYKALVNNNIGHSLIKQGKFDIAESYLREAVSLWKLQDNNYELINTLDKLADTIMRCGSSNEALEICNEAYEITTQLRLTDYVAKIKTNLAYKRKLLN